ncbi:hypothetical protein SAMN05216464_115159 [Mucilaginibacter pineti]|uniref:Uncharacterized protein n=1 Tax=Mucilaginibacter pineti TaxID=1391627 RepID=A0A1G7JYC4_9SPHI|nr:hypothetical protein [Mucilaginibacter pineti]SDF29988.1 hypothetical protein SAMN05216464_115159 [Mucilaginibacter pineti]
MGILSEPQITQYDTILKKIITDLETQRQAQGSVPDSYHAFLKRLTELIQALKTPQSEKDWFRLYLSVYENSFFDNSLNPFNTLVKADFLSIWLSLGIREKQEVAKLNDQLYRFINTPNFTDQSLEQRVIKPFESFSKTLSLSSDITQEQLSGYDASLGAKAFRFHYAGKDEQKAVISCWCKPDYVHITIKNEGLEENFVNTITDALSKCIYA